VFGELRFPILANWEVNVAARYDDYDSFGGAFSPQISTKFAVNDSLALRGSYGEGFKAPNLTDLYSENSQSFNSLRDFVRCAAQGIADSDCPQISVENFIGGNPDLEAEESENFNVGLIADIGGFSASIDYYRVSIEGQIRLPTLQTINFLEGEGSLPSGVVVNRSPSTDGAPGTIRNIFRPNANVAFTETDGIDLNASYAFDTDFGSWDIGLQWVHILKFEVQNNAGDEPDDIVGESSTGSSSPENRINTHIRLTRGDFTFSWNSQFIDGFENPTEDDEYDSWLSHDFTMNWYNAFGYEGLDFTAGVQNLTEELPRTDPNGPYSKGVVLSTYPVYGRVPFINFKYSFQ
jgi:iron complex outermembrane receptor protein